MGSYWSSTEEDTTKICTNMQQKLTASLLKAQKIAEQIDNCERMIKSTKDANIILDLTKKLDEFNAMMDLVQQGKFKKYMKLKNLKKL